MGTWHGRLGVVEFATSGTNPDIDRIVAARVAVLEDTGVELARWDWGSDRADALVGEVSQTLRTLLALGTPIAVFDAAAGLTLLDRECRRRYLPPLENPEPILDPLLLDHLIDPTLGGVRTLSALAERHAVSPGSLAAGRLVRAMLPRLQATPTELHARQRELLDSWPVEPLDDIRRIEETQPFPAPSPRPSDTVPIFDFGPAALEAPAAAAPAAEEPPLQVPTGDTPTLVLPIVDAATLDEATGRPKPRRQHLAAAIVSDPSGRTVVVRRRDETIFGYPGGPIERGESAFAALARQLRDGLGVELDVDETEFLGSHEARDLEPGLTVRVEVFALTTPSPVYPDGEVEELYWLESPQDVRTVDLSPLTLSVLLPLWAARRPALF